MLWQWPASLLGIFAAAVAVVVAVWCVSARVPLLQFAVAAAAGVLSWLVMCSLRGV